jgi:hypothetical protein
MLLQSELLYKLCDVILHSIPLGIISKEVSSKSVDLTEMYIICRELQAIYKKIGTLLFQFHVIRLDLSETSRILSTIFCIHFQYLIPLKIIH